MDFLKNFDLKAIAMMFQNKFKAKVLADDPREVVRYLVRAGELPFTLTAKSVVMAAEYEEKDVLAIVMMLPKGAIQRWDEIEAQRSVPQLPAASRPS